MSRIHSKDTKPELIVRSALHKLGYRFRIHKKNYHGKHDIALPKYKIVIFGHDMIIVEKLQDQRQKIVTLGRQETKNIERDK